MINNAYLGVFCAALFVLLFILLYTLDSKSYVLLVNNNDYKNIIKYEKQGSLLDKSGGKCLKGYSYYYSNKNNIAVIIIRCNNGQ